MLAVFSFLLTLPFGLWAEGTRQVAPSSSDLTMLLTNRTGFGNFAQFNGPADSRLYFSIRDVGEILHIGLSGEYTPGGVLYSNTDESRYRFRIVRASDGAVVHGPFLVDRSNANVSNWTNAVQGAYPVSRTEGGVPVYVFTPSAPGDYYIEFQDVLVNVPDGGTRTDGTEEVLLGLWDFTVLRNNAPVSGRLWSRNWAFRTPRNSSINTWPDCGWNREFRGTLYSYTTDRFVSKVEFMDSGFQGLSFNVAFNSRGPGNAGSLIQDRRSLAGVNQTSLAAEHQIFLHEPDIVLFPNGECGVVTGAASLTCNNAGEFCLPVTVTKPGQVEVILDFNKNGRYDAGTEDVVLGYSFFGKSELSTCIPWNRLKGNGQPLRFGDNANIIYIYTQGVQHWSVYDVEFIKNGYCVEAVRPLCGESITNVLYWDDTLIPQDPGTGQPKDGQGGQTCRTNGARTWNFFNPNPTAGPDCLFSEEELTVGYGDKNTINTWWFASVSRVSYNNVLFLTCNISGDNEICAGATTSFTAAGSAANASFTYSWSGPNGFTSNQAGTGLISTPGQYCVTITDGEGCQTTCCQTLTVLPKPVLQSQSTPVSCTGGSDGSLSASASGGKTPYTYTLVGQGKNLSNGSGNFTGLPAGAYTLSVVDGNGCQADLTVQITAPAPLSCTVLANQLVSCSGLSNGSATVVPQGGNGGFTFLWDNGETTATATQLSAGLHTVTVTDSKGCSTTCSTTVQTVPALSCSVSAKTDASCFGSADGTATVSPDGGTGPYTFLWSNNQTTQTATGLIAGAYSVTVTDINNCSTTCNVTIAQPAALLCTASVVNNVSCFGGENGSATVTAQGGTGPYTYKWSNNQTTQSISGLPAGNYSVTVTDNNKCTTSCTVTITQPVALLCNASVVANVSCFGGSDGAATVVPQGGVGPYTFKWSNNLSTQSISGLSAGAYSVTVTDQNGCSTSCSVSIGQPSALSCTASVVRNVSCFGGENGSATATAQGGTAPYSFKWSNNQTTQSISGLSAGTYSVTVTDKNGCTSFCSVTISQPTALSCTASVVKNVSCFGGANGAVTATAQGGTAPYSYKWSNNLTTQSISGLPAGIYTVTVTDKNGCTSTCKATITQPTALSCTVSLVKGLTCFGGSDAAVAATAQGGTAPYTYKWSTNHTSQSVSNLPGGTYSVTVTDKNGCTTTCSITVQQPGKLVCTTKVWEHVSCYGGSDGAAMVSAAGGTQPYSFKWSNGQTGTTASGLKAGTYKVTVTDKNGCHSSCEVVIGQPAPFVCTIKVWEHVSCFGGSDGTAMVLTEGGTAPFSYQWSNGFTGSTANGLKAGKYWVTVTDKNGCKSSCEVLIHQPEKLSCTIYCDRNVSCVGGNDGMATVSPEGGAAPYSYLWSNGETTQKAVKLKAGTHTVVITDGNGCKTSCTVEITEPKVWVLCPPDLHLNCGDPELDWEIKAWLMKAQLENACGPAQITNNYHPGRFTGGCTKTQVVTFSYGQGASLMSCTAKIVITDNIKPTIQCPPNASFACNDPNLESKIKSWLSQAKASDNCELKSLTNNYSSVSTQPCGPNGQRVVTFTATDACGLTSTCQAFLTIADNQAPVVKVCPSDLVLECGGNHSLQIQQWLSESVQKIAGGASDNCDPKLDILHDYSGALPSVTCQNSGGTRVVFTVRDDCGNTTTCAAFIRILDTQAPVISCSPSYSLQGCNSTPPTAQDLINQGKVTAFDQCGSTTIKSLGMVEKIEGCKGTRTFTFQAVDPCGRSSESCTISVSWQISNNTGGRQSVCEVTPLSGPVGSCGQWWTVPDYSDRVKLNGSFCEFIQIVQSPAPGTLVQLSTGLRIQFAGTDQCGRRTSCDLEVPCRLLPPTLKFCTYNATYWGDNNNTPMRTPTVTSLLAQAPGKALQIGPWTLDADCIDVILPGQPLATDGNNLNLACNDVNNPAIRREDVHSMLIQAVALTLNTLHNPQLKTTKLGALDCAITIPAGLSANSTVEDLLKLAGSKLPAFDAKIAEALTNLNECYAGGCSSTISVGRGGKLVAGSGAADQVATTLELQPNPASSFLRLTLNTAQRGPVEIRLMTVQGQIIDLIRNEVVVGENVIELDLNHLRAGTYLLQVRENGQVFVERFVKADF